MCIDRKINWRNLVFSSFERVESYDESKEKPYVSLTTLTVIVKGVLFTRYKGGSVPTMDLHWSSRSGTLLLGLT